MATAGSPILGGMFGQEQPDAAPGCHPITSAQEAQTDGATLFSRIPPWEHPAGERSSLLLINARSAIDTLVGILKPNRIWLPAYLCPSLYHATVGRRGIPQRLYAIGSSLTVEGDYWLYELRPGDLVVFISYFGFGIDPSCVAIAKQRGAWVLEDACGGLFRHALNSAAHFVVSSPRKFVGVSAGGILGWQSQLAIEWPPLSPPPADWLHEAEAAFSARTRFDQGSRDHDWFPQFQRVEATQPCGPYALNEANLQRLHSIDFGFVAQRRRENYQRLLAYLAPWALYKHFPDDVVPLGFPLQTPQRNEVVERLHAQKIFAPIHWPLHDVVPREHTTSWNLAETMLTLPCDQRISPARMTEVAEIVRKELER